MEQGQDYNNVVKVFHISLLYFQIGDGMGSVYHGKTLIHEVETGKKLSVQIKNKQTDKVFESTDIFPEYFFISIPRFDGALKEDIDEWLYVMKYEAVPDKAKSPYMKQVAQKLDLMKMTPNQRLQYDTYMKKICNDRDELEAALSKGLAQGREEGEAIGIEKGQKEERRAIAIEMLHDNEPDTKIIKYAKITADELSTLKKTLDFE
jgi:hypothetical protein